MWGRVIRAGSAMVALGGAGCAGAAPASAPLPSGEPVAVGYATVTTGMERAATDSWTERRMEEGRVTRIEDLLAGRAGVNVTRLPDGRISVRIRGPNTLLGSSEPLLVLDGIPVEYDTGGLLRGLHARDVVRVEVLKDPATTAIYGVRGGAGVIKITTRRAR